MSTSWKVVCMTCQKVSPNPHPNYTPVVFEELTPFIREHHDKCGQDFKVTNEYQDNYWIDCDLGYYHSELTGEHRGGDD